MILESVDLAGIGQAEADALRDFFRPPVEGVQPRQRADPQRAVPVLVGRGRLRTGQTVGISRVVRIVAELTRRRIESMQTGGRCEPEYASAILQDVLRWKIVLDACNPSAGSDNALVKKPV